MAAARRRHRLKTRTRRPPIALRALRGLAALSLLGLAGLVAYEILGSAGFQFRWQIEDPEAPSSRAPAGSGTRELATATTPPGRGASRASGGRAASASTGATAASTGASPPGRTTGSSPLADSGAAGRPPPPESPIDRPPRTSGSLAAGEFASIDFETFGDGRPVCTNCAVSDQWRARGLVVSFHSYTASSPRPFVLDARNFLPADASTHALGPALSGARGLEVGVTRLDFPGRPRKVAFTLYGPHLIDSFAVTAWSDGERLPISAQTRSLEAKYNPAGRGLFRAERILVESARGVDRISLDGWGPPGHVLLVDNLAIDP